MKKWFKGMSEKKSRKETSSMSAVSVIESTQWDPNAISFSTLRKNKNGGKTVYIQTTQAKSKSFFLQLPFMRSPYGLSAFTDDTSGRTSYSLDLSLDSENDDAVALRKKLEAFDDLIVETVANNSVEWLGKEFSADVLRQALYKPLVRPGRDEYPSTIKLKVRLERDGSFEPECFNMKRESFPLDQIEKGQKVMTIVEVASMWFIDQKFGVTLRLRQALCEQSEKLPSFAFQGLNLPEPEDEEESTASCGEVDE